MVDKLETDSWKWLEDPLEAALGRTTYFKETAIGQIGVSRNAAVVIHRPEETLTMTPQAATEIAMALLRASQLASMQGEKLGGVNTLTVRRVGVSQDGLGTYIGRWRNIEVRLRLSQLRKARRCYRCRQLVTSLYVRDEAYSGNPHQVGWVVRGVGRSGFVETCRPCVYELVRQPRVLRSV